MNSVEDVSEVKQRRPRIDEEMDSTSYTGSAYSTSRVRTSQPTKVFNLNKLKQDAIEAVFNKKTHYHNSFRKYFTEFAVGKQEEGKEKADKTNTDSSPKLFNKLCCLSIIYISSLFQLEKVRLSAQLAKNKSDPELEDINNLLEEAKQDAVDRLTELSFCYAQILKANTFRSEHILTFRDTLKEEMFYETLYHVVSIITTSEFENQKIHPIIDAEIARVFRTKHFGMSERDKKEMTFFIKGEDLYHLKHQLGVKIPSKKKATRKNISSVVKSRSPLLTSVFPSYNKSTYTTLKGIDRGFDDLRLDIPPEVLFTPSQKPLSQLATKNESNDVDDTESIKSRPSMH